MDVKALFGDLREGAEAGYTALSTKTSSLPNPECFHPEDLESLREERRAALARGLPFEIEQRALRMGSIVEFLIRYNPFRDEEGRLMRRWFLIRVVPLLDEQGSVVKWFGSNTDIEDR